MPQSQTRSGQAGLGNRIAPWRFLTFLLLAVAGSAILAPSIGWREGVMLGFDTGALIFIALCVPLFSHEAGEMRRTAKHNDANRVLLLVITFVVSGVILVAVASELMQQGSRKPLTIALVLATLSLCWMFSTLIYTLHYAHIYYTGDKNGKDCAGIDFPATREPDYWDFLYFSSCMGMTFQTSDTDITARHVRRTATFHCLAAFMFNIGVIAFSINVIGGGS